jgi:heme a synthase
LRTIVGELALSRAPNRGDGGVAAGMRRPVAVWLFACCTLIFLMIVVGGVTRLTHSGLSIVEWQPIVGALPPLSDADWAALFRKYQATPEFIKVNHDMDLAAFKRIFWWEYGHRLLGRAIGVVFLMPLIYFALRGWLGRALIPRLFGLFALGAMQGGMGWYMVKSGLVDDPHVSQYRLAAHLGIAFAIYGFMFWTALDMVRGPRSGFEAPPKRGLALVSSLLCGGVFLMVLSGAIVAGIHAGLFYNTFPLMNGSWVPPEILTLDPWYLNVFNNMATVQFDHRAIAWLLAIAVPWFAIRVLRSRDAEPRARRAAVLLVAALILQIALGITTLLLVVPVPVAAAHQAGAVVLFSAVLNLAHSLRA